MQASENALDILTLRSYRGVGNAWILREVPRATSRESLVGALSTTLGARITVDAFLERRAAFARSLQQRWAHPRDGVTALGDPDFPGHSGALPPSERPTFLFYRGNLELLSRTTLPRVAVIGTTTPTAAIVRRERRLAEALVRRGAVIVSGLALGCDSIAHRMAVELGAPTVAILPSPTDRVLPRAHEGLAREIVAAGGLLVSEYGREHRTVEELRGRYCARDRLQALFCDLLILVASHAPDSARRWPRLGEGEVGAGSRHACLFARKLGRRRAALYDEAQDRNVPLFDLNRDLLRDPSVVRLSEEDLEDNLELALRGISPPGSV